MKILILIFSLLMIAAMGTPPSSKEAQYLRHNLFKLQPGIENNLQGFCKGVVGDGATTTPIGSAFGQPVYPDGCASDQSVVFTSFTRDTAAPLTGNASLKISKPASDRQNDIIFLEEIRVDESRKGKPLEFSFNYKYSEDFAITDGLSDIRVYVLEYDTIGVDQRVIILPISDVDGSGKFQASLTTTKNYVRPFLYVATTNANAYDFWVDDLLLTDLQAQFIPFMSDMEPVTVTGSWTTNTTYVAKRAVQGQFAYYDVTVKTTGAPTSTTLTLNIPDTIDFIAGGNTESADGIVTLFSSGYARDIGTAGYGLNAQTVNNDQKIYVILSRVDATYGSTQLIQQNVPFTFANGDSVNIKFKVPIQGWTSGVKTQAQIYQSSPTLAKYYATSGSFGATPVIINFSNKVEDLKSEVTTGASWKFQPKTAGIYSVKANLKIATNQTLSYNAMALFKNGVEYQYLDIFTNSTTGGNASGLSGTTDIYLTPNDYIDIRASNNSGGSVSLNTSAGVNNVSITLNAQATAFLAINRSTTKYLASNLTSTTNDIASLRMTNLIVGKRYRVDIQANISGGSSTSRSYIYAIHDSTTQAIIQFEGLGGTAGSFGIFTATNSSVTFNFVVASGSGTLFGNGTGGSTKVTLTELNNTVEGNF